MSLFRIAFVCIHVGRGQQAVPLGAACVAAAIRGDPELGERVSVELVESFPDESLDRLCARIADTGAALVGFSLYLWNRAASIACASKAKRLLPQAAFCVGGPDAGANPAGLLGAERGPFDFLLAGEGESAAVALVSALLNGRPPAAVSGPAPLEEAHSLPSPWLSGVLDAEKRESVLWELARGCPYACTYCYESKGARKLRRIGEDRVRAELALFRKAGVKSAFVLDPTFNADKERARRVLDLIAREAPDIHFHFEARAESLDRGLAKRFAAVGASVQIGLQTAREDVAERVGRPLNRGLFASKIGLLNEEGAVFGLDLMYGLPGDDLGGFRASLDFVLSLYPNSVDVFRLAVLPGTVLADQAASFGLDFDADAPYLVRSTPTFPARDLAAAEALARSLDFFYNKGRAVPWFNQTLHPLSEKPSFFLEGFSSFLKASRAPDAADPVGIERLQLTYLDRRYEDAGLEYLLPAVWDVVRFNGAYARALAEGIETTIDFNYDPNEVLSPDAADLEGFVSLADRRGGRFRVVCGSDGPELIR